MPKLVLLVMLISTSAFADPFNSYRWNRDNVLHHASAVDRHDWFEWWYFKVVDPVSQDAFCFTYGVINPWDTARSKAGTGSYLQFGDFKKQILIQENFPVEQFKASYASTQIELGPNIATDKHLQGHTKQGGHDVSWNLDITPDWRFNAMGWFMKLREISNIFWYPAQASAYFTGWIQVDQTMHHFERAPAYQDRNWGRSFPKWWTWLTSNHFKNSPGTVFAGGGGRPKALEAAYLASGLGLGLRYHNKEYFFRTSEADLIKFKIHWGTWEIKAQNKKGQKIELSAFAPQEKFMILPFTTPKGAVFYDYEALLGKMTIKLWERKSALDPWQLIDTLETDEAGIEWGTPKPIGIKEFFSADLSLDDSSKSDSTL